MRPECPVLGAFPMASSSSTARLLSNIRSRSDDRLESYRRTSMSAASCGITTGDGSRYQHTRQGRVPIKQIEFTGASAKFPRLHEGRPADLGFYLHRIRSQALFGFFDLLVRDMFNPNKALANRSTARSWSSSFACIAASSRFWLFWIRNTIRNVMMVVLVFTTSCQVPEHRNGGPQAAKKMIHVAASTNMPGWPAQ